MVIVTNLILGAILENAIPLLILGPMLAPIAEGQFGIDPLQFGIVLVFNVMLGQFTPPVGLALFVMSDITGFRVGRLFRAVLPFLVPLMISLLLMAYVPWITLLLPAPRGVLKTFGKDRPCSSRSLLRSPVAACRFRPLPHRT